ncbi:hypothetical protein BJ138DRAFT_1118579 [Hygrophoropsis aurantiaca]|uniref:Uncharacterized protein n=1 Tax=Hygrophoropsis aurantiaca TaxID=72124 RepID=A0ACB7ZW52_9AGAM|nr:hypothetical protein BJ138DRAFT_1118579 [Hygrophoropsis aurantiaca]
MSNSPASDVGPRAMQGWVTVLVTICVFCAIVFVLGAILHTAGYFRLRTTPPQTPIQGPLPLMRSTETLDSLSSRRFRSRPPPPTYNADTCPPMYFKGDIESQEMTEVTPPQPAHIHSPRAVEMR